MDMNSYEAKNDSPEFSVGQKVSVKIPDPIMKCYVEREATIKEYDGRTGHYAKVGANQDWYTVILDNDIETRVRGANIKK